MKEKYENVTKMEFLLTLNDNIVVQRFFNVKGYNPKTKGSIELHNLIKEIQEDIHGDLKMKSVVYLLDNQNQIEDDPEVLNTSNTDGPENFNIFIKLGDETICQRQWDGKMYPPKIRYTVDIRPHLKKLLKDLTDIFSEENLTYEFMDYQLI
jgi:hypothetical protein